MPYINPGQFIEPYLRPYGKQTIKQIPQIQQERRATERLGALKPVWAEQVAESQQKQEIAREAQEKLNALSQVSPEQLQPFIGQGQDPATAMKLLLSGKAKLSSLGPTKELTPVWKEVEYVNEQGQRVKKHINVNDPSQNREYPVTTVPVKIGNETFDLAPKVAAANKAARMAEIAKDEKAAQERTDKQKTEMIKFHEKRIEELKEAGPLYQEQYTEHVKALYGLIKQSTGGMPRDPEIDKARAIVMEEIENIKMYEKASQVPEDLGAQLVRPKVPPEQFVMPKPKETQRITWGEPYINKQGGIEQKSSTGQIKSIDKDPKNLKEISVWFKWHLGQYNSAKRGVGQFLEDPNKDQIAKDELGRAATMAKRYLEKGGNLEDLGLVTREVNNQIFIQIGPDDWMRMK